VDNRPPGQFAITWKVVGSAHPTWLMIVCFS
jgi:hypothetical protein